MAVAVVFPLAEILGPVDKMVPVVEHEKTVDLASS